MEKVVLALSGGMDSATLLGSFLQQGAECHCIAFNYGSKHAQYEIRAAVKIMDFYNQYYSNIGYEVIDLRQPFLLIKSNLMHFGGEIPEGAYDSESMKLTVVPGRNLLFASYLAAYAESIGANTIALGVHSGDHAIYPDCRPTFLRNLERVVHSSTDGKVRVIAPFERLTKAEIVRVGIGLPIPVPYHLTRTCYKDQAISCGKCGSCDERLKAFAEVGIKDPIDYE